MSKRRSILILVLLTLALGMARAQDSSPQSPTAAPDSGQQPETTPAPAFGQENPAPPVSENPPISGIDQPGLEPHAAPLSYLQPGAHLSEAADSNVADTLGAQIFIRLPALWAVSRCSGCGAITNWLSTLSEVRDITARTVSASSK